MPDTESSRTRRAQSFFGRREYHGTTSINYMSVRRSELVRELTSYTSGARILDLGSGSGTVSLPLLRDNDHLTLVDYSEAALDIARANIEKKDLRKVDFRVGDLLSFTGEAPYDLVLCIGVLAHVDSTTEALRAVSRNLAPGGECVVQLTPSGNPINWLFVALGWLRGLRYRPTSLAEVVETASSLGLEFVSKKRHLLLVPGIMGLLGPALLRYDRWVSRTPLAHLGTSDLLLFRKPKSSPSEG